MRTLDEVIKALEDCEVRGGFFDWKYGISDALHYLKEYRKLDSLDAVAFPEDDNPALSWNELKQMEGKPVWIEEKDMPSTWIIIWDVTENWLYPTGCDAYRHDEYGNSWQAYRKERE